MVVLAKTSAELSSESIRSLYDQLCVRFKDVKRLQGIGALLSWDQEVNMPPKAATTRAQQVYELSIPLLAVFPLHLIVYNILINHGPMLHVPCP